MYTEEMYSGDEIGMPLKKALEIMEKVTKVLKDDRKTAGKVACCCIRRCMNMEDDLK